MRTITDRTFEMLKDEVFCNSTKRDSLPKDDPLKAKLDTVHTKLRWLKVQCHRAGVKGKYKQQGADKEMNVGAIMGAMLFVEKLEDKVDDATLPTRKELHRCNDLLAILKEHCYFDVDWRTDIIF